MVNVPKDTLMMEMKAKSEVSLNANKKSTNNDSTPKTVKVNGAIKESSSSVDGVDKVKSPDSLEKLNLSSKETKELEDKNSSSNSDAKITDKNKENSNSADSKIPSEKSDKNSSEIVKSSSVGDSQTEITKETSTQNGVSKINISKKKENSASSESRPDTPMSHSSLDLDSEEKLLHIDADIDDQEDFCEEKLLQEPDEDFIVKDNGKEEMKNPKDKTLFDNEEKSLTNKTDDGSNDRQEKEIEKILKNLNSSLEKKNGNDNTETTTFKKITSVNNNLKLSSNSADNSNSKTSENDTDAAGRNNSSSSITGKRKISVTNDSSSNVLAKRKLSDSSSSNSKNPPKRKLSDSSSIAKAKLLASSDDSDSNISNKSSKSNSKLSTSDSKVEKTSGENSSSNSKPKPKSQSEKNTSKSAITFSEALKSIAMEDKLLQDQPQPLTPTAEITNSETVTPPASSLTLLQPVSLKNSTTSSSLSATDSENDSQGKKRSLPSTCDNSLKPDLKKIRFFKSGNKATSENITDVKTLEDDEGISSQELSKKSEKSIQSNMQEDKESHSLSSIPSPSPVQENKEDPSLNKQVDKDDLEPMDEGEPQRKSIEELRKTFITDSKLRRIKRKDLESLIIELFVDKVLYEHQLGQHKDLSKRLEATLESTRKKAAQFHKEIEDLKKVTHRLKSEHLARKGQLVAPVKVKRSVGIQATPTIIGKGMMNVSSNANVRVLTPSLASINSNTIISSKNVQGTQATVVNATKTVNVTGQPPNSGTVMVPFVVQPQNGNVGSQFIPVSTTRIVRTPLTPINSTATQFSTTSMQSSVTGVSVAAASSVNSSSSFIDLTDDDEAAKNQRASLQAGGLVAFQRTTAASISQSSPGQFVALNPPSSVGQLLLVPSPNGQSAAALVVSSVANTSNATGVVRTTIAQNSNVKISTPVNIVPPTRAIQPARAVVGTQINGGTFVNQLSRHPAPLPKAPPQQTSGYSKKLPPLPTLRLNHKDNSIVLSWNMAKTDEHERIASYQIYAYQEGTAAPTPALWKKVGSVKALELPMACTLTQFMPGHVYHFAVRAVDIRSRLGPFSDPKSIRLGN